MKHWLKHSSHLWAWCLNQVSSSEIKLTYVVQAFRACGGGHLANNSVERFFVNKRLTQTVFYCTSFPNLVLRTVFKELWPSLKYVDLVKTSSQRMLYWDIAIDMVTKRLKIEKLQKNEKLIKTNNLPLEWPHFKLFLVAPTWPRFYIYILTLSNG